MPTIHENDAQDDALEFIHDDELTLQAETISDFLTTADFSEAFAHPALKKHIKTVVETDEDGESVSYEYLPGNLVLQVIDEDDLLEMFVNYLDALPQETLEDTARLAVFSDLMEGPFKKGGFKRVYKGKGGPGKVNRMLGAMLNKESIKRDPNDSSQYTKAKGYAPGTKAGLKKYAAYKKKNAGKLKKARMAALKTDDGHVDNMAEAAGRRLEDMAHYGLGFPVQTDEGEVTFRVSVDYSAIVEGRSNIAESRETDLRTPIARGAGLAASLKGLLES
jgi:hypothetical protein